MLSDPRFRNQLSTLLAQLEAAEVLNDPRTQGERIGSGGKPGSREPGYLQCDRCIQRLEDLLKRTNNSAAAIIEQSVPRERHTIVVSVGGVPLNAEQAKGVVRGQARLIARIVK